MLAALRWLSLSFMFRDLVRSGVVENLYRLRYVHMYIHIYMYTCMYIYIYIDVVPSRIPLVPVVEAAGEGTTASLGVWFWPVIFCLLQGP